MISRAEIVKLPETKRKLLDAGVGLMRARGFNATTVDDICTEAGVTKGGFFHYFKSKEEIAKAAMTRFQDWIVEETQNAPFRKLADPLDRVFGHLDFIKESFGGKQGAPKGCLIGMLAQELSLTNPAFRSACQESFSHAARDLQADLAEAKALHAPEADFDPKKLSILYVTIIQGSLMLAKASESNQVLIENIEQFRDYLKRLFDQPHISAS